METRRKNMELKARIAELEKCNLNLQEQIDKLLNQKQ
jgi:BMFP domain-containing protein YqiC